MSEASTSPTDLQQQADELRDLLAHSKVSTRSPRQPASRCHAQRSTNMLWLAAGAWSAA
jgi:hypothetical protein